MVLFLSTFYNVRTIFSRIFGLAHYTIFYSQINGQNWIIKKLIMRTYQFIYIIFLFYSLISICIITFFHVRTKLNNHILKCFDLKCMYKIESSQIDYHILHYSNTFFSKWYIYIWTIFSLQSNYMTNVQNWTITFMDYTRRTLVENLSSPNSG